MVQLKLIANSGRTVWLSPKVTLGELGGVSPSIVVHDGVHYLMSGGAGNIIYYQQMNPLVTSAQWPQLPCDDE